MNPRTRIASLLMAATVTIAIPALADSVCACTTGNTGIGISAVNAAVARVTQTSPAFPDAFPGDEVIQAGTPAAVTYKLAFLDRNGEQDFDAPVLNAPNPQQLMVVDILRPDGSFVDQSDAISIPSTNGCTTQEVARTSSTSASTGGGTPKVAPAGVGIGWVLMTWQDLVPNNGIVTCDFVVDYNAGGPTPIGVYTVRPGIIDGIIAAPRVNGGSVTLDPVGYGPSQDVTTTIFNLQAITTAVGNTNGTIDFGAIKPGEIALGMGGIKLTPGGDVVVTNEATSQPTNLMVSMQASDLYQNGTQLPTGSNAVTQGASRTYAPILCDRFAIAMERQPTPGDAMVKKDAGAYCDVKFFDNIPTLFPGQQIRFNAGMLEPGRGNSNFAFAAGQYLGTLKVCLTGPGGQGDPISIGSAPTNPIPSFNANLAQPVDEVGPAQTAA